MAAEQIVNITVCGDGGCGKSSITLRLVRPQWSDDYDPTIEDSYSVTRILDGHSYQINLTDTAGQEEYRGLFGASSLATADAFLLVYDITVPSSLPALSHFLQLIDIEIEQRLEREAIPPIKIVVGNKCDLKTKRAISAKEGVDFARAHGCMFMETSALNHVNVEETFALLVRRVAQGRHAKANSHSAHAADQTQPLRPVSEKQGVDIAESFKGSGRGKGGFWAKLRCW